MHKLLQHLLRTHSWTTTRRFEDSYMKVPFSNTCTSSYNLPSNQPPISCTVWRPGCSLTKILQTASRDTPSTSRNSPVTSRTTSPSQQSIIVQYKVTNLGYLYSPTLSHLKGGSFQNLNTLRHFLI